MVTGIVIQKKPRWTKGAVPLLLRIRFVYLIIRSGKYHLSININYFNNKRNKLYYFLKETLIIAFISFLSLLLRKGSCRFIKVNESRYKQCEVTLHFSTRQNILQKILRRINIDIINWEKVFAADHTIMRNSLILSAYSNCKWNLLQFPAILLSPTEVLTFTPYF